MNDTGKAISRYKEALEFVGENQNYTTLSNLYLSIGSIYLNKKNIDSAYLYLFKAFKIDSSNELAFSLPYSSFGLAEYHYQEGNLNKAKIFYEKSIDFADKVKDIEALSRALFKITILYERISNYKEAHIAYKQYDSIQESVKSLNRKLELDSLVVKYQVELKEEQNRTLKYKLNSQSIEKRELIKTLVFISIIMVFLIVILILVLISKKRYKIIKQEESKVFQLQLNKSKNEVAKLKDKEYNMVHLVEEIKKGIKNDDDWLNFIAKFEILDYDFFSKLKKISNEPLTKNDYKIAALVRLKLSNKEISQVLFISDSGVRKAKGRLGKKLQVLNKQTLTRTLVNI